METGLTMEGRVAESTHEFPVQVTWQGNSGAGTGDYDSYARTYRIAVAGKAELKGSAAAAFAGDASLHNPEDLFVAAVSACHMLFYLALCARSGVRVEAYEDSGVGSLELEGGGTGAISAIRLHPRVRLAPHSDRALAARLHEVAHERCFIARSVCCDVTVTAELTR